MYSIMDSDRIEHLNVGGAGRGRKGVQMHSHLALITKHLHSSFLVPVLLSKILTLSKLA